MGMINAKVVNNGKVETRFTGKNLTTVGGMGLFHIPVAEKVGEANVELLIAKTKEQLTD